MKKIMFDNRFSLVDMVLDGSKTMTRRVVHAPKTCNGIKVGGFYVEHDKNGKIVSLPKLKGMEGFVIEGSKEIEPKYKVGDEVAIALSYRDIDNLYKRAERHHKNPDGPHDVLARRFSEEEVDKWKEQREELKKTAGWGNKMFTKSSLMPFRIRFKSFRLERLQDISSRDCLKEGVIQDRNGTCYYVYNRQYSFYDSPKEAFQFFINRLSKGNVWEENPWVFAYEFELI